MNRLADWMTPQMARRKMGYLTVAAMNAALLHAGSPVRSKLQQGPVHHVRRWCRMDVERHRAPCPFGLREAPCLMHTDLPSTGSRAANTSPASSGSRDG